ncbi:unnamed protein product [Albugo candida]|uniref:[histone H3]-dimethyl-L-lysine(36) demethylase n=1 Tax=Albugo candida TaxID=65357 RepID=A0A024G4X3_9STRA|nr:unnamed protein product [Albugo candida]|eukprot:CCI41613.1 unnamed protein product [Albugo candida]
MSSELKNEVSVLANAADFGMNTANVATDESNEVDHGPTQLMTDLVDPVTAKREQSHNAEAASPRRNGIESEIVCVVCDGDITGLSIIGRNVHINRCLDNQLQQLGAGSKKRQLLEAHNTTTVVEWHCPHCAINLSNYSDDRRLVHVNLCLDRGTSEQLKYTSTHRESIEIETDLTPSNNQIASTLKNRDISACNTCGVNLTKKTLVARVTHIKQCSKRQTRSRLLVPHRSGSVEENMNSLTTDSTFGFVKPSDARDEIRQTVESTSNIKQAARNAFDIMMKGSQALKKMSKFQPAQFSRFDSSGKSWKKPKLESESAKKMSDIKCPEFKIICGTKPQFIVDGFRFANKNLSSVYFLTHFHSDHYVGLTKKFDAGTIYCSQITANLVMMKLRVDAKYICIVELNTPTIIHGVEVIFLDANHCPGACIILFRQKNGMSFLHTGDFRYHPRMLHYPALRSFVDQESTGNETHRLSGVYLDTTYLKSKFDFSPQETVIKHVVELVEKHYSTQRQMYIFGTYTIGKERVFMEVAKHFGKKMCVSKEKFRVLSCYGWDENNMDYLTTNSGDTCFFVMPMHSLRMDRLPGLLRSYTNRFDKIIAFRPTGWTFQGVDASLSKMQRDPSDRFRVYGIPYSEHSSFSELCQFVKAFKPKTIIPTRQTLLHAQFARFLAVHNVNVPSMGDSISEGTLVEVLKGKGEYVQEDQVVAVLETDKLSVDVRSPVAGTIVTYHANLDDSVGVGKPLLSVDDSQTSQQSQDTVMQKSPSPPSTSVSEKVIKQSAEQVEATSIRRTPLIQFLGKRMAEKSVPILEEFVRALQSFDDDTNSLSIWEYSIQTQESILPQIDSFFTEAFSVQSSLIIARYRQNPIPKRMTTFAGVIYALYSEINNALDRDAKRPLSNEQFDALSGDCGLLHLTRLMPFCQLFGAVNESAGLSLLNRISTLFPRSFQSMIDELNSLYKEYLENAHNELVSMPSRSKITIRNVWITNLFGATLSFASFTASEQCTMNLVGLGLLERGIEQEDVSDFSTSQLLGPKSIVAALMRCYESDLPQFVQKVSESVQAKEEVANLRQSVANVRLQLLNTLGFIIKATTEIECKIERRGEILLELVSLLVSLSTAEVSEQGTYIADLWTIMGFKNVIVPFLREAHIDEDRISCLKAIIMAVPQRGAHTPGNGQSNGQAVLQHNLTPKVDGRMIQSIKELFPTFGDGFTELLLIKNEYNVERAINQMLEGDPLLIDSEAPPESLQRSDREYARLLATLSNQPGKKELSGLYSSNATSDNGSRVWLGKKAQDEDYDPQVARYDPNLADLTKRLNEMHTLEQSELADDTPDVTCKIDEYDDEYDDEFDDEITIKASSEVETLDDILAYNRRVRAKEEEDAYWKSMRNPNHIDSREKSSGEEADEIDESKQRENNTETSNSMNESKTPPNTANPPASKRSRARDTANKSKKANHHRKERAFKKRGILICCGARKGFRFTSEEIRSFRYVTQHLNSFYARLDTAFVTMPLQVSRYRFENSATRIQDNPQLFRIMDLDSDEILNRIHSEEERICFQAFHFQWLAQQYLVHFDHLRNSIEGIRHRFQSSEWHCISERSSRDLVDPVDVEIEAKTQHPFPSFLYVLVQKYHREKRNQATLWTPSLPWQPVDSIAALADFIIDFLWPTSGMPLPLSFGEIESVRFLLRILKVELNSIESLCHRVILPQVGRGHTTRKGFQKLVYQFLVTVCRVDFIYTRESLSKLFAVMLKVGVMVEVNVATNKSESISSEKHECDWAPAVVIDRYMSPIDTNGAILVIEMESTLEIKEFLVPEDPLQWIPELRPYSDPNGHRPQNENDTAEQVEDLTNLKQLDSFSILATLESRFSQKKIYTNTGSILLAINPFQGMPSLYHSSQMTHYLAHFEALNTSPVVPMDNPAYRASDSPASPTRLSTNGSKILPPHIYQVAGEAFRAMRNPLTGRPTNQSILVSGESGSGKTESTKFLMEYLARAGDPQNRLSTVSNRSSALSTASTASATTNLQSSTSSKNNSASSYSLSIAAKVLQTNILLESFGNARTLRNDNSSRFGKFIKLHFTQHGKLIGASIQTYLLEKVRLVSQTAQERNYHIFYEMMLGASEDERKRWRLSPCLTASLTQKEKEAEAFVAFRYLNQSGCVERRDAVQERKMYKKVIAAMSDIGFTSDEIQGTFDLLAALLHIGNLTFAHEDVGTMDASSTTDLSPQSVQSRDSAAFLLSVDANQLEKALSARKIRAGSDFVSVKLSAEQANNARDAFTKSLYSRLFDWLVWKMNAFFKADTVEKSHSSTRYIGILDIFGFEVFPQNSFEQLCINFANETLQQQFNEYVFKMEQKEYEAQGVDWKYVEYSDNQEVLNLISQRPTGILPLIDEECLMPKGNDTTLASKLYRELDTHPRFLASRTQKAKGMFVVAHYAGDVEYSTSGFLDKNKDLLHQEAVDLFLNVPREGNFVRLLCEFGNSFPRAKSSPRSRASVSKQRGASVCWQFKEQLSDLLETLRQTNPHYVRCLKPNDSCSPELYDRDRVLHQLKCNGVMEAVRVARAGFPVRILHEEFLARYFSLRFDKKRRTQANADTRGLSANSLVIATVRDLLQDVWVLMSKSLPAPNNSDEFASMCLAMGMQMGISKTFLKKKAYEQLEALRLQSIRKHMIVVYSSIVCNHARRRFLRLRRAIIVLQSVYRLRKYQAQTRAHKRSVINAHAVKMQSFVRMVYYRTQYRKLVQAVRVLQCRYRYQKHRECQRCSKEKTLQFQDSYIASSESSMESFLLSNDVEGEETSPLRASDFLENSSDRISTIAKMDTNGRKSIRPLRTSRLTRTFSDQPQEIMELSQISTKSSHLSDTVLRTTRSSRAVALPRLDIVQQAQWINDDDRFGCHICNKRFSVFRRKHHCRACGEVICGTCSLYHRIQNRSTRICVSCVAFHSLDSPTASVLRPNSNSNGLASSASQSPFEVSDPSSDGLWINPWPEPPYPDNESERLVVLRELNIRDLALSGKFNMYCEVAAKTMKCPIAYVSIVEETEQILVANIGMAHSVLPREMSFCAHTICQASVLVVLDTRSDTRFRENPMVKGEKGTVKIRYYAGATIFSVDGHALGTVAVFDTKPRREVDQDHIGMLQHLSFLASEKMMQSTILDNGQFNWVKTPLKNVSSPSLFDKRPIQQPLETYPNDIPNLYECDIAVLRYRCDLDEQLGCRAYPQLFPSGDIFNNWSPYRPESIPIKTYSSVCRFNISSPYEFRLAKMFRNMQVPFVVYGVPELEGVVGKWTDEYLADRMRSVALDVHITKDAHYMHYDTKVAKNKAHARPYARVKWTYLEFQNAIRNASQRVFYYMTLHNALLRKKLYFIPRDLTFFTDENLYGDFFVPDRGNANLTCRFGMQGNIVQGHVDSGMNMIAMVRGRKRYVLAPPSVCSCLGLATSGGHARHTLIDWGNLDRTSEIGRLASECPATEIVVSAGDLLYIPPLWYHHIVSLDESIQCNDRSGRAARQLEFAFIAKCLHLNE